ncbi:MAG: bacteriophage holin [Candidatus Berkiella sp.]
MNASNCQTDCCRKMCACCLGTAIGVTWALGVLMLGVLVWKFNYGAAFQQVLASIYAGYAPTPKGILLGTLFALVDGFICGLLIAWIYNLCHKICCWKTCRKDTAPQDNTLK